MFYWLLLQTLLRYAEDAAEGKKLLNLLSDVQANITVFVPHNGGFAVNQVIVNTKTSFLLGQHCNMQVPFHLLNA